MAALAGAEPGISDEALYAKVGFKPHSVGQRSYLNSKVRFNVPCCGRRYGKSQAAGHRMTYKSFIPDSINWIVGTTYRIGEKEFRVVWDDYNKLDILRYCKKSYSVHQGDMSIKTPWGSLIMVVSADNPDTLLGEGLSHVIMSEAARHNVATWEQYIEPALSDLKGSADFPSTPQGFNWYHGLFMMGQIATIAPPTPSHTSKFNFAQDYASWQFPTWENTVRFPGGFNDPEIQRVKRTVSPLWFDQEYGAKFTSMAGSIYDEWDEKVHVLDSYEFDPTQPNYLAFDYGFANPTVCLDIQINTKVEPNAAVVWREYYASNLSTPQNAHNIYSRPHPKEYRVDGMYGDPRGADEQAIYSQLLGYGYVQSQDVRWKLSVEQIKRMLAAKPTQLRITRNCTNLVRQMSNLHVKELSKNAKFDLQEMSLGGDGNIQHKVDDHAADALRYFIGPYFVLGGNMHLSDIYGQMYAGSESHEFTKLHTGVVLDDLITLG